MTKRRYFLHTETIDTSVMCHKGRISLPTCVKKIIGICAVIDVSQFGDSGGFLTVGFKDNNDILINSAKVVQDFDIYDNKNIDVNAKYNGDLFFVFRMLDIVRPQTDADGNMIIFPTAKLKIIITYN